MRVLLVSALVWGSFWSLWWVYFGWLGFKNRRERIWLHDLPLERRNFRWPSISIIVPARNEESAIESSLKTLVRQDYSAFEIIAVNDRSTDGTGKILDKIAAASDHVKVVHVDGLPAGWIGKCNALKRGVEVAKGEYILFTDADGDWDPSVLKRTALFMADHDVDYVSMLFRLKFTSIWEKVFVLAFYNLMNSLGHVWDVSNPESRVNVAIGLFQIFKREVYDGIGGMEHLALAVTDDLSIAGAVKAHGFKCRILFTENLLSQRWQEGLRGHILGIEKNGFAICGFSYLNALRSILRNFSLNAAPFLTVILGLTMKSPIYFAIGMSGIVSVAIVTKIYHRQVMSSSFELLFLPFGALFLAISLAWSALKAHRSGGCRWRESFYPIKDLVEHQRVQNLWFEQAWSAHHKKASLKKAA